MDRNRSRTPVSETLSFTHTAQGTLLCIGSLQLPCQVRFSARRSMGLRIQPEGVQLALPLGTPLGDTLPWLQSKAGWLLSHWTRLQHTHQPLPTFESGAVYDWLGEPYRLKVLSVTGRSKSVREPGPTGQTGIWWLGMPTPTAPHIGKLLAKQYQSAALPYLTERVQALAPQLISHTPTVALMSARRRWGSCSAQGHIRLNWRLLQAPPAMIDYVVFHELAHILEFNHSPRFWQHVGRVCPDYKAAMAWFKVHGTRLLSW